MANKEDVIRTLGCVIKGKFASINEECSACGILLSPEQGLILSHGSILSELCLKNKSVYSSVKNGTIIKSLDLTGSEFEALIDSRWALSSVSSNISPATKESNHVLMESEQHPATFLSFTAVKCTLLYAFRNENFHKTVSQIMPESNWAFTTGYPDSAAAESSVTLPQHETYEDDESSICFNLLSYFLILKTEPLRFSPQNKAMLPVLKELLLVRHACHIGDVAEIVATPFGGQNPNVFFNTYSRGVVCNVGGAQGCWILSDARCIPGSEGGPVFTGKENQNRQLTGVIAASLCWKNKEWVGFSLVCSISSIISSLNVQLTKKNLKLKLHFKEMETKGLVHSLRFMSHGLDNTITDCKAPLLSFTVLVKVGSIWGTGVIIDKEKGIIITCNHVIKDSYSFPVMIKPFKGSPQYKAIVIYSHSGSLNRPYDIAVLKCAEATTTIPHSRVPKACSPKLGEKVWVVGHALFGSELDLRPSLSAGVVSKIITFRGQLVMVQSTCAVHAGASGGPLLNTQGDLVGIMVCNTVDKGSNSAYPHVNMSVPAVSIWPVLQKYIHNGDSTSLSEFEITDPYVRTLWALENNVLGWTTSKL